MFWVEVGVPPNIDVDAPLKILCGELPNTDAVVVGDVPNILALGEVVFGLNIEDLVVCVPNAEADADANNEDAFDANADG